MTLSDLSVRRPVLATVLSLIIIAFGLIAFTTLPLRELPDVDRPIVSVNTSYPGASAQVVENQITRVIEDQLSGIDGIDVIGATSRDGRSSINIEFTLDRDIEDAANDVRNAVSRARGQLPADVDEPVIRKADADADAIIWYSLESTTLNRIELTDYADRYVVDRLAVLNGVANVQIGGAYRRALRIWLDTNALAARGLTVQDVESALRSQNIELPAGYVQSQERDYQVRVARAFETPEQFQRLPISRSATDEAVVRLGDVARVEIAPEETRSLFRGNRVEQVGLGIVRQSQSNALDVGREVKAEIERITPTLPEGTRFVLSYDATLFIDRAIQRVGQALLESTILVVLVIFLFLGSWRAAFIPAAVIPVCLVGAFLVMSVFGFSINLLTLLALVLAIGLVVDDSIVVLENVQRRVDTLGEPPLVAAERGTRQVFFAIVATSAVLVAVFAPLLFVGGYVGSLFVELAVTIAGVVVISAFAALSLSPMMCSKLVKPVKSETRLTRIIDGALDKLRSSYRASLEAALQAKGLVFAVFGAVVLLGGFIFTQLSSELTPAEDRGNLIVFAQAPEGAGFEYTSRVMSRVEDVLMSYVESGEAQRVLVVAPGFGDAGTSRFSSGIARVFLANWEDRHRSGAEIETEINQRLAQIPGATIRARMQSPFSGGGGGGADGASIVLLGSTYEQVAPVATRIVDRLRESPNFQRPRMNYEPTSPRVLVDIDRERAAALGVSVQAIGRTLEATMGSRRVNTITDRGEEYYVYLQAERDERSDIADLSNKFVRSDRTGELIPLSTVVTTRAQGDTAERRRMNRQAAITVAASIAGDYAIGDALNELEQIAREEIGEQPIAIDYTGAARQFKQSTGAIVFAFGFALLIVFLVLAAQFESFVHPLVIMLSVPLALTGGLFGLFLFDFTLNIYSQIGLIILIALAAKNGILIVEFANQLRDEGRSIREAIVEASDLRVRPVLMTSVATVVGAIPLIMGHGAGGESRMTIGVVIFFGLTLATMLTLFVIPAFYDLLARYTKSPEATAKEIEAFEHDEAIARPAE
ncbi:efflux RND transporter permease subunit [Vitreimonas sp.]|uniref:efflux RND transporter permease subunit n=1 Tax=Vitreimonas sp. TaxID=3069702 RepID=UPI002EDB82FC